MATYREIQQIVRETKGFTPKSCWIAHVLSDNGLTKRQAPNRMDPTERVHPCPPQKREAIEQVLIDLGYLISQTKR